LIELYDSLTVFEFPEPPRDYVLGSRESQNRMNSKNMTPTCLKGVCF